jgi:hypothetical protein
MSLEKRAIAGLEKNRSVILRFDSNGLNFCMFDWAKALFYLAYFTRRYCATMTLFHVVK